MRNIFLFSLILCVSLLLPMGVQAEEISDVPEDHESYDTILSLIEKELFHLYDDGTFQGEEKINRFQLAEAIMRILEYLEREDMLLTEVDGHDLRKLTVDFRSELVQLTEAVQNLEKKVEELAEFRVITVEDIARYYEMHEEIQREISLLEEEVALIHELKKEFEDIDLDIDIDIPEVDVEAIMQEMEMKLDQTVQTYESAILDLQYELDAQEGRFRNLEEENRRLKIYTGSLAAGMVGIIIYLIFF